MFSEENKLHMKYRPSIPKNQAVAKMLGWVEFDGTRKHIRVVDQGVLPDKLSFVISMTEPLSDQLRTLWGAAREEYSMSDRYEVAPELVHANKKATYKLSVLTKKAESYLADIDKELAKGKKSALILDPTEGVNPAGPYITLRSLEQWAQKKYGISIFELSKSNREQQQLLAVQKESQFDPAGGTSGNVTVNLLTTLAFLVEEFSKTAPLKFRHDSDDRPNIQAIAKHLEQAATKANRQQKLRGQSAQTIMTFIEKAMAAKRSKLPVR